MNSDLDIKPPFIGTVQSVDGNKVTILWEAFKPAQTIECSTLADFEYLEVCKLALAYDLIIQGGALLARAQGLGNPPTNDQSAKITMFTRQPDWRTRFSGGMGVIYGPSARVDFPIEAPDKHGGTVRNFYFDRSDSSQGEFSLTIGISWDADLNAPPKDYGAVTGTHVPFTRFLDRKYWEIIKKAYMGSGRIVSLNDSPNWKTQLNGELIVG